MARSSAAQPPPRPKAATIRRVKPKTAADQAVGRDLDAVEVHRRGVAGADAVLVLGLAVREAGRAGVDHEPGGASRSLGEHGVEIGEAAVRDPLLAAGDPVAADAAVGLDALGARAQGAEVAARLGLGRGVGHQQTPFGDGAEEAPLLLLGAAEVDRIAAQEGREHAGGDAQIDARHRLADPVDVEGAAPHAAVGLRDEEQLDAELAAAHGAHRLERKLVVAVELEQLAVGQPVAREVAHRFERQVERLPVQTRWHGGSNPLVADGSSERAFERRPPGWWGGEGEPPRAVGARARPCRD